MCDMNEKKSVKFEITKTLFQLFLLCVYFSSFSNIIH